MAFPFCHTFGGMVQASFCFDHVAGGEAVLAASVLAEFDQIGRVPYGIHHRVELADFTYLRRWRKSAEQMQSYTMKTVITAVVAGAVGALWLGIKTIMGK